MSDYLTRFAFQDMPVRGAVVRLTDSWAAIRERNPTDPWSEGLLGEAVAASALMISRLKIRGQLSVQLQGGGPIRLALAQCDHRGNVRGIIRTSDDKEPVEAGRLSEDGTLAITIEQQGSTTASNRYQGLVPINPEGLAASLRDYFESSEQLATFNQLAADGNHAAGMILQKIPGETSDTDGWNRVQALASTLTVEELLVLPPETIIKRLFHREAVITESPQPIEFGCHCSRARVADVLRSLGQSEVDQAARSRGGVVQVTCEFCNEHYRFDPVDVAEIFASGTAMDGPYTRQ